MSLFAKISFGLRFLLSLFLTLASFVILLALSVPAILHRRLSATLARLFRPDLDGLLKPKNALLALDLLTKTPCFNLSVAGVFDKTSIGIDSLRKIGTERIFQRLITSPADDFEYERLRQSVTRFCGYFFWKKQSKFDIRDYIRLYEDVVEDWPRDDLPADIPVKKEYSPQDLKKILSYLIRKPWRKNKGLWEIILFRNYNPGKDPAAEKQSVIFLHFHHCLADGYSILKFAEVFFGNESRAAAIPSFRRINKVEKIFRFLLFPFKAWIDTSRELAHVMKMDRNDWVRRKYDYPSSKFQCTWTEVMSVDRLKKLKTKFGVGFNAVVQAICAGAIRKLMLQTGARVPEKITCFLPTPLPKHRGGLRIHAGVLLMRLYTGEADPKKRLYKADQAIKTKAMSVSPMVVFSIMSICGILPLYLLRWYKSWGTTAGMSIFPSKSQPFLLPPNATCNETFFVVGVPSYYEAAFSITSLSICENIKFTLSCRENVCQDQNQLDMFHKFMIEEIQLLEDTPGNKLYV